MRYPAIAAIVACATLATAQPAGETPLPAEVQNVVAAYAAEVSRAKMVYDTAVARARAKAGPALERLAKIAGAKDLDLALAIRAKAEELGAGSSDPSGRKYRVRNGAWSAIIELLPDGRFIRSGGGKWRMSGDRITLNWEAENGATTTYGPDGRAVDGDASKTLEAVK